MNAAESLVQTAVNSGIEVCFANPGTSEMDFVKAIDGTDGMRAILGLFEGVCTGAADGYGRMAGKPAMTLLHLGIENIKLGPSLPAFITPNVLNILVDKFKIAPIGNVDEDLAQMLGN